MKITVLFEGKPIDLSEIEAWEKKHSVAMTKRLQRKYKVTFPDGFIQRIPQMEIKKVRAELVRAKQRIGSEGIRSRLSRTLKLTDWIAGIMTIISRHKKKSSVVDIYVHELPKSFELKKFCTDILNLMTMNSDENAAICLAGSPDHLILEGKGDCVQEIIEITGGAPMESRFLNYYGDENGVDYPKDNSFPIQMAGVSRLKNGLLVGDVRHQYRMEENGFHAKLADEFPKVFTRKMITEHQFHLACEFLVWYHWLLEE